MSKQTQNSQTIVTRSSTRNNNRNSHTANTTNIIMDSGNISESLPSTISTPNLTMTNTPTSLNPTDILAFIKEIPSFDGNPSKLQEFITNIEEIITLIQNFETPYHSLLLRAIRNKVIGRANDVLGLSKTDIKWENIKANLIQHYGYKKSEAILIRELQTIPENLSLGQLFYNIIRVKSQLIAIVKNDNQNSDTRNRLYDDICLNTFLMNLREPFKSLIKYKNPKNIEEAYEYCREEKNFYSQKPINNNYKKQVTPYSRPQTTINPTNNSSYRNNFNNNNKNYDNPSKTQYANNNQKRNNHPNPFNSNNNN